MMENSAGRFDMGSFEFAYGNCSWCHPGGGPLEYDRAGFRYDGRPSGLVSSGSINPNRDSQKGDYYTFVPGTGIVSRVSQWQDMGVAEADCLMCHISGSRYANLERNYTHAEPPAIADDPKTLKGLKYSATLGLSRTSLITGVTLGSPNVNPGLSGWQWASTEIPMSMITKTPDKQNCAICHFPDKSWFGPSGSPNRGPVDSPLGFTSYQKLVAAGTVMDDDEIAGVAGKDGKNDTNWPISNGRVEGGKRGESINDPANPDAHMTKGFVCATCHYNLDGTYGPKTDAGGQVILPQVSVQRIDHQFAKGDAFQDTKGMDQLDLTVTCRGCHIDGSHPNKNNAPRPLHAGYPAFHFEKIDCRTCHIPVVNGPVKQTVADFSAGPYRGFARVQTVTRAGPGEAGGIGFRPLKAWQVRNDGTKIVPHGTMAATVWVDGGPLKPTFQRPARVVAESYRGSIGDRDGDGVYDWPLNRPNAGRTVHIVNEPVEIAEFVKRLNNPAGFGLSGFAPVADPILNIYNVMFSISHNVQPINRDAEGRPVPGPAKTYTYDRPDGTIATFTRNTGPLGINGCVECHSSSKPGSADYSTKSAAFFDLEYVSYFTTASLTQTCSDPSGVIDETCTGPGVKQRVRYVLNYKKPDGSPNNIDLSARAAHGQAVPTTVNQAEVLGYEHSYLAKLVKPETAGAARPYASFSWTSDASVGRKVNFYASASICPSGACSYTWSFGGPGVQDLTDILKPTFVYDTAGTYTVTLSMTDTVTGLGSSASQGVEARSLNTPPTPAADLSISGMIITITDSSTDSIDPQDKLSVTVIWGDGTSETKSAGQVFTKTYTSAGTYTINHKVVNTAGMSSSADLSPDDPLTLSAKVTVPVKYSISGRVTRQDGVTPIANAAVYLKQGTSTKYLTSTKTDGSYTVTGVAAGTYDIVPSKAGYTFTPISLTVDSDKTGIDLRSVQ